MPPSKEKRTGIAELIEAHRDHLQALQVQAAKMGLNVPAHVVTEIERYEREIERLIEDAQLAPSAETIEKLGETGIYQLMYAHIMRIDGDMWRLSALVKDTNDKLDSLLISIASRALSEKSRGD